VLERGVDSSSERQVVRRPKYVDLVNVFQLVAKRTVVPVFQLREADVRLARDECELRRLFFDGRI
jgi:hypothetical protein